MLNAADDVLDVSLEDVLLSDEMRSAFRAFLGENDVVVDTWRSAGALLDCMRKHRIDMKHAGGKDIEASAKAADTVEDLRDQLKLVWSHKTNEWSKAGSLPEGVLKGSLHREAWEALCPVDQYGDERDVEDVLVEELGEEEGEVSEERVVCPRVQGPTLSLAQKSQRLGTPVGPSRWVNAR